MIIIVKNLKMFVEIFISMTPVQWHTLCSVRVQEIEPIVT